MKPDEKMDRIIAQAMDILPDGSGCPPNCEYCERDLKEAAPRLRKFYAVLTAAGFAIVLDEAQLLEKGRETKLHE